MATVIVPLTLLLADELPALPLNVYQYQRLFGTVTRAPKIQYRCIDWRHHVDEKIANGTFSRYYRTNLQSFNKLVRLLEIPVNHRQSLRSTSSGNLPIEDNICVADGLRFLAGSMTADIAIIYGMLEQSTDINEMDEHRNVVIPTLKKYKKVPMVWYCLKFPPRPGMTGVKLSVREIYQSDSLDDDTSLDLQLFPVTSNHPVCGQVTTWWASWNVVVHDTGVKAHDRKRGKPDTEKKKSKAALQAAKYASSLYGVSSTRPDTMPS